MRRKTLLATVAFALTATISGCTIRRTADRVDQGAQGPLSPAESGQNGADAYNRPPYAPNKEKVDSEHQTAGLMPEYTNGKVDDTMEGSGNLAWQGSYEREKRARSEKQRQTQAPVK